MLVLAVVLAVLAAICFFFSAIGFTEEDNGAAILVLLVGILFSIICGINYYNAGQDAANALNVLPANQIATIRTSYLSADPQKDGGMTFLAQMPGSTEDYKIFEKELGTEVSPAYLVPGTQVVKIDGKVHAIKKPQDK